MIKLSDILDRDVMVHIKHHHEINHVAQRRQVAVVAKRNKRKAQRRARKITKRKA